ncbi:MAG: heparan-alpha-glucosaminide N-acetyltransferase domain-containing protein [Gemmatimonadaceae bacterium]
MSNVSAMEAKPLRPRLDAVDVTRGLIMIIMALDHTRDYFGIPGQNPTDMATTTTALFFTRWITHFCAPTFFLLTGTGAYLSLRKKSPAQLSQFLFTRGLWLLFVEAVIMRCFAYQFNFDYRATFLIVLWALGLSMIVLAALVRFPTIVSTVFGIAVIVFNNAFDGVKSTNVVWTVLHSPGFLLNTPEHVVFVAYPLLPWVGVMALGFSLGQVYGWSAQARRTFFLRAGIALIIAFLVMRGINSYGDPNRWSVQASNTMTFLSFLNTSKYPPSLLFLLMTLGPVMLLLRALDGGAPSVLKPALVFGRVPMFYFMLHFFLIHLLAVIVCYAQNGSAHWMFESPDLGNYPFTSPPNWGFALPIVYAAWLLVVLLSFPLCRWFAALKQRRSDAWLSYL